MKCLVVLCGLLAVASATPGAVISYSYANPAGVTFRGTGVAPAIGVAAPVAPLAAPVAPVAAPVAAPVEYAAPVAPVAPAPLAYAPPAVPAVAPAPLAYAPPAVPVAPAYAPAVAPALAVHQKVGYVNNQVLTSVPGVANVPVTKLALTQGVTQKLVDVAQPAVKNRRVKVRRPALRKEFYDIEHRIIVRPAGSATLELSQPIAKEQKGPAVITPTDVQQLAPVVRYGIARQIIDGPGVSPLAQTQVALARGALPAGPAPPQQPDFGRQAQEEPQGPPPQPRPQFRNAAPRRQPLQLRPQGPPQEQFQQQQEQFPQEQQFQPQQQQFPQPQQRQQFPPQQQQQQFPPQQQPQFRGEDDAIEIGADGPGPQGPPQPQRPPQGPPPQGPRPQPQGPPRGRTLPHGLTISPDMPIELQARLVELLNSQGGSVTEVLNENGAPANQASVLQVADALQDVSLQGGEKITTRRIVVTRPIETVQEVDIQEPATKIHRVAVNTPTLFKTPVQGVAQVPVAVPAVKNVATPFVKNFVTPALAPAYAAPVAPVAPAYAAPAYAGPVAGPAYAPAGVAY